MGNDLDDPGGPIVFAEVLTGEAGGSVTGWRCDEKQRLE